MTTYDDELFAAAVSRARVLLPLINPDELTADESNRILLDSAVMALAGEWGIDSYDDGVELVAKHFSSKEASQLLAPEFCAHLRRSRC